MRPRFVCVVVAIVLASVASVQADTTSWDAYTGFNSTSNTASDLWQYMGAPQGTNSGYWLLPVYGAFPGGMLGNAWQNSGDFPAVGAVSGEIRVQPELPGWASAAVIGWNSPITGNVAVSFSLTDLDAGANGPGDHPTYDGVTYNLFRAGDTTALSSGYVANGGASGTIDVSNVAVSAGTMLYLQIGPGTINHWYDTTGVSFTVTQTPEPSTIVILLTGVIGLLAYAWRKRK